MYKKVNNYPKNRQNTSINQSFDSKELLEKRMNMVNCDFYYEFFFINFFLDALIKIL